MGDSLVTKNNSITSHAISEEADMEMLRVEDQKLDSIGRNEQRASNTVEGDTHLGMNRDEEDFTYHETAVPDPPRLDINAIEAVSFQLKDLPTQPRVTHRAYTGEAPRKLWRDDDPYDLTEQGVKHRVLDLPSSSQDLEQERQQGLSRGRHSLSTAISQQSIHQDMLEDGSRNRSRGALWTPRSAGGPLLTLKVFTTQSAPGDRVAQMRQITEGPKLYIASLNNALEATRQTSRVASEAHKEIPRVYVAMMHETHVAEVRRLSSIKEKLRRAMDDQRDRLASSEMAYDEVAKAARHEVLELRADNSHLLKEGDVYRQRRLDEENRQLNQTLQARSGNERLALLKAQLKDGELAREQKAPDRRVLSWRKRGWSDSATALASKSRLRDCGYRFGVLVGGRSALRWISTPHEHCTRQLDGDSQYSNARDDINRNVKVLEERMIATADRVIIDAALGWASIESRGLVLGWNELDAVCRDRGRRRRRENGWDA